MCCKSNSLSHTLRREVLPPQMKRERHRTIKRAITRQIKTQHVTHMRENNFKNTFKCKVILGTGFTVYDSNLITLVSLHSQATEH